MGILVVGTVALDSVETPFGKVERALGGSATHFTAAASFLTKVALVGVVGADFPQSHLDFLRKRDVDLRGLEVLAGKTFHWKGRYGFDLNSAETLATELNVLSEFSPKIPVELRQHEFVFLANIHPALQIQVLEQVKKPKLAALDTMNFWIQGEPDLLRKAISRVNLVVINEGEARQLTRESSLLKAARQIQILGPQIVVIKQGEYGALLFHGDEIFSAPGLPIEEVKDPTGAGDSFAGGMMGFLSRVGQVDIHTLRQAIIVGSAMASFNVEDFSCDRLKRLTHNEIEKRVSLFKKLSHFEEIKL